MGAALACTAFGALTGIVGRTASVTQRSWAFGMLGAALFAIGLLAGLGALVWLAVTGQGQRWVWTVIQTCLILGSVFFATGLLGEQVAVLRAELRELRRRVDATPDDSPRA